MATIACQTRTFTNIEAIIFDKDGTLEDSSYFLKQLAYERAKLIGQHLPEAEPLFLQAQGLIDDYLEPTGLMAVGSNRDNLLVAAGILAYCGISWLPALHLAEDSFRKANEITMDSRRASPLFPGCRDLFLELTQGGLTLGILSADSTANVEKFIERHQLQSYISLGMGGDQLFHKPDPRLFTQTCELMGIAPERTIMVGDAQGDIMMAQGAHAGGAIGICWHHLDNCHLDEADVKIDNLNQIKVIND